MDHLISVADFIDFLKMCFIGFKWTTDHSNNISKDVLAQSVTNDVVLIKSLQPLNLRFL